MVWAIVAIVVVVGLLAATLMGRDDPFKTAAADLGLTLGRSVPELSPHLDGMVGGIAAKVDIAGAREPGVRYRVFYPALGVALRLERETAISRTLGQLGRNDQAIGSATFDERFKINTSRPDALKTMLTPELQRQLISLIDRYPNIVVSDGEITLQTSKIKPPAAEMVATTRDLVAVAKKLDAVRPAPLSPPEIRPRPGADSPPPAKTTEIREPQTRESIPRTPETPTEPTPAATPPLVAPANPEPTTSNTGLPPGFFDAAFGANRLSFEKDEGFDEVRGTIVRLSGTVKQATHSGDDDAATKAVITVAQIENDLYGKTDIDAVVYLQHPVSLVRGQHVTFTGTADRIDAFMRNLFIVEASLIE